jgi:DNA-binding SARP family transcriptional activator
MVYRIRGGRRTISELQAVRRAFVHADHVRGQMLALAYMIETAVFVGYDPAARRQWVAEAEDLLNQTRHLSHFTYAKALLWQQIGLGSIADATGDLHKGRSACQNAAILGKRIGAYSLVSNALSIAAHAHVQAGDFKQAEERLQALQPIDASGVFQEYGVLHDLAQSHLAIVRGNFASAADQLKQVEVDIDALGLIALYPAFLEASGLLQIYEKHFGNLEKTHRHLQDVATLLNNPLYKSLAFWLAGLSCYHQGRFPSALALARRTVTIPDQRARATLLEARNRQLKGFIALNSGQFEKANAHFQEALHYFDEAGLGLSACETLIGRALAGNALQKKASVRQDLQAAFQAASTENYQHFPVIRPADLARACVLCINLEIPTAVAHARHLLATRLADTDPQILDASPNAGALARSIDTGDTRKAIYRARIPVIEIRTLGGLQVLRQGSHPIRAREWRGSRPALLFKAILVHGGRHIPKDILIEALWPDRHPDKSLQNFKVTLHRLRKLLEPNLNPALGSAYIHLKDNLVSLDQHLCEVDTVAFHRLCRQVRRPDPGLGAPALMEICRKALALYQGDFLPEEPYLPWAEMKRTTLREEFIQLLYRLGERLRDENEFGAARRCYRRIIRTDSTQEKAQRRLMRLLAQAGRAQEALRQYREFRTFIETEIGAAPETATVQLYQSIRNL